jgi:DNA-binding PadR family transcriptional regulator
MSLDHAILGFLNYQPMTGYDLKKAFDQSVAHFWSATQSHIYKSLDRLEAGGLLTVEVVPQDKHPSRKVYRITPAGSEELLRWLATPMPVEQIRMGWLIQAFFASYLPDAESERMVKERIDTLRHELDYLDRDVRRNVERGAALLGDERVTRWWFLTLDTGVVHRRAELELLQKRLKEKHEK